MAAPVNGNKTSTVKLGQEGFISRNFGVIEDLGSFIVTVPGSGTWTADADGAAVIAVTPFAPEGQLVVRVANQPIYSQSAMVVDVAGTDESGDPLHGYCTIDANAPEDQAYVLSWAGAEAFKTITGVTTSNGVAGDGFEIALLPNPANDVEMCYVQDLNMDRGTTVKAVYCHFTLMHNKKLRGERKFSGTIWYTNHMEGFALIGNRDVTLRIDIKDDAGNTITETIYVDKARFGPSLAKPGGDDAEWTSKADGVYGRLFVFS
ncbi:MAG: hypothetical protein A2W31_06810 [Planctomycetes bacterium RBG_16_64_10]|nr:MAG: hypothetical protein A2W31_06810 [Planctomycetes bacterium RBG_16_64_10]